MSTTTARPRYASIDALRGLAVLGMSFSGMVAAKGLPAWMYHAQHDPTVFGITWVDLVFPFFLFSLGAAIPFVVDGKLANGASNLELIKGFILRGLLLGAFSILGEHWRPYTISGSPGAMVWSLSLLGFGAIVAMFARWPASISPNVGRALTAAGWVTSLLVLAFVQYPDGTRGLANFRNDPILMVLANVSVSGGLIYLYSRGKTTLRLAIGVGVALVTLTAAQPGVGKIIWDFAPTNFLHLSQLAYGRFVPVFYHFEYHKYLLVVIPGTICGEILTRRSPTAQLAEAEKSWAIPTAIVAFALSGVVTAGLLAREMPWTMLAAIAVLAGLRFAIRRVEAEGSNLLRELWRWGSALLVLGILAEPIGGGIRKDGPTTLSYHLVCSGLAFIAVLGLWILIDGLRRKEWRPIIETGANPILGYVAITNLITAVSGLTHLEDVYAREDLNPWLITIVGALKTLAVLAFVAWCTRKKFFVRA